MSLSTQIDLNARIVKRDDVIESDLDGETIMMSLEREKYYTLDPVGSRIWALLDEPHTLSEACATLLQEYDVDPDICRREVLAVVQRMLDEQLIDVIDG